jgi:hypothetical protein
MFIKKQKTPVMKYNIDEEESIEVQLPYHDRAIITMATVKVNLRVWQRYAHLRWRVLCGTNGTVGCYVVAGQIDRPMYLHRKAAQFYYGDHCLRGGLEVDHLENPLVNTIQDLRICTHRQNCQARGPSSTGKVQYKGVWQRPMKNKKRGQFFGYVTEYCPPDDVPKITKSWNSAHLAALFYNMLSKHFSPQFNYQNRVTDEITDDERLRLDTAFIKCVESHNKKLEQLKKKKRALPVDEHTVQPAVANKKACL